ncbi:MAG: hypothetical protein ACTS44_00995 [Candidatus Hodgkinia cicadicola]
MLIVFGSFGGQFVALSSWENTRTLTAEALCSRYVCLSPPSVLGKDMLHLLNLEVLLIYEIKVKSFLQLALDKMIERCEDGGRVHTLRLVQRRIGTFCLNETINGELYAAVESGSCVNRTKPITVDEARRALMHNTYRWIAVGRRLSL